MSSLIWLGLLAALLFSGGGGSGLILTMLGLQLFPTVGLFVILTLALSWLSGSRHRRSRPYTGESAYTWPTPCSTGCWGSRRRGYAPGWSSGHSWASDYGYGSWHGGWGLRPGFASGILAGAALSGAASYGAGQSGWSSETGYNSQPIRTSRGYGGTKLR